MSASATKDQNWMSSTAYLTRLTDKAPINASNSSRSRNTL